MSKQFIGEYKKGGFNFGKATEAIIRHANFNVGKRFILQDLEVESKLQRRFYQGAVLSLWAYLDGNDYRDSTVLDQYTEYAKTEFNPEYRLIDGKTRKMGASTKGKLKGDDGIINKVIDHLEENYAIDRVVVLNPKEYKKWKDEIFPYGGPDTYIGYLKETKKIK